MPTIDVKEGQCLVDLAMQESGKAERLFDYAVANGMSITQALTVGSLVNKEGVDMKSIVAVLSVNPNYPASDCDDEGGESEGEVGEGIGFWYLNEYEVQ